MKIKTLMLCTMFILSCGLALAEEKLSYAPPSHLPHTQRQMKTAGFWISHHTNPDRVVMNLQGIARFNHHVQDELNLTKDIFAITRDFKTESLAQDFDNTIDGFHNKGYYTAQGVRDDTQFIDKVKRNMNLTGIVLGVTPRYGLVTHFTYQRLLPTGDPLYEQKDDIDFDQIQNSGLDVGTPVAVVHVSADKQWYYVISQISDGWVAVKDIALGDINTVKLFAAEENIAVVIKPKADIFLNEKMTDFYDMVRMGTHLPMAGVDEGRVSVNIPAVDKEGRLVLQEAFMNEADVSVGYLPYTPRTIYNQAFAMLNQPYGWGDVEGEQDCSRFLQMVFATVGIVLPRNSKEQGQSGVVLTEFTERDGRESKMDALAKVTGAITILPMKGHIMLYLGLVDGTPYVIQETSGYRQPGVEKEITRSLNRVVVSDLSLGEGSSKNSLLKRINRLVEVNAGE